MAFMMSLLMMTRRRTEMVHRMIEGNRLGLEWARRSLVHNVKGEEAPVH